jgi:hypothetical protein
MEESKAPAAGCGGCGVTLGAVMIIYSLIMYGLYGINDVNKSPYDSYGPNYETIIFWIRNIGIVSIAGLAYTGFLIFLGCTACCCQDIVVPVIVFFSVVYVLAFFGADAWLISNGRPMYNDIGQYCYGVELFNNSNVQEYHTCSLYAVTVPLYIILCIVTALFGCVVGCGLCAGGAVVLGGG